MARFEIDTDSGTIKKIEDNSGCGAILIIVVIIALLGGGDGSKSTSSVEYWKGDPNCPIFVARDDGSLVAFKKILPAKSTKNLKTATELLSSRVAKSTGTTPFKSTAGTF